MKLYKGLEESGWAQVLKMFLLTDAFDTILIQLLNEAKSGERFTPELKYVFRAFEECNYKDLKVVIIGSDPYTQINQATGIPFSVKQGTYVPPALKFIFNEIQDTVYPGQEYLWDTDLSRWSNQGVLMINSAFTTPIGKVGKHYELWHPFIAYLLDMLKTYNPKLIYVFMGKTAKEWSEQSDDNENFEFFCTHPSSASYTLKEKWDSGNIFNLINFTLKSTYKSEIIW